MRLPLKEQVAIHVCYRDVFSAPVEIERLKIWMGVDHQKEEEFEEAIAELKQEGLLIQRDGFLACPGQQQLIEGQKQKADLAQQITEKGKRGFSILSKIPFVRYVGISGSVAADNPTADEYDPSIDLDLFVITSSNTLWSFALVERVITNLIKVFRGKHFYCFNYITEDAFLEVHNKNFYTATELVNLKTIIDKGMFDTFIQSNTWYEQFYAKNSISVTRKPMTSRKNRLIAPFNYSFFALFGLLRSFKKGLVGIKELNTTFSPDRRFNLRRISNERGGYEQLVRQKFDEHFRKRFAPYYTEKMVAELFPNPALQFDPKAHKEDLNIVHLFNKYNVKVHEKGSV